MSRSVPQVATTLEPESPLAAQSAIQVDKEALEDARLRSVWESTMTVATGQPHLDAHVLMLSWEEEWDDLNTDPEVKELANVFCEKFNYKVERKKIKKDGTRPQLQVMLALAQFVHDHDRPGALLIVYYAGHGIAGKPGQLQFQPKMSITDKKAIQERNGVFWDQVEHNIKTTEADILTILDCCFAGNLVCSSGRAPYPIRNFEVLAATGKDTTTPRPGPTSFTKALIWALEKLAQRGTPFSTSELYNQIGNEAPDFPRKRQTPILQQRWDQSDRRLILARIPRDGECVLKQYSPATTQCPSGLKESIDLRFFFDSPPTVEDVRCLSVALKDLTHGTITATRIGWVGLSTRNIVKIAASHWLGRTRRNNSRSSLTLLVDAPLAMNGNSPTSPPGRAADVFSSDFGKEVPEPKPQQGVKRKAEGELGGMRDGPGPETRRSKPGTI